MNKLFVFLWYIATQPFIEIKNMSRFVIEKGSILNYPRPWRFIFFVLMVGFYLAGNKFVGNIFLILVILTVLQTEWESGEFMDRWRKRIEKRAEKQVESGGGRHE